MKVEDVFMLICTQKMFECRDFYIKHFGFKVDFQSTVYVQLRVAAESGGGFGIAFMPPDHPFGEAYRAVFSGKGAYLTIQVEDAGAALARLKAQGAPILREVVDEAWGQRHFLTQDPHGTVVDVVQVIEPAPGYFEQYQVK